jgi:hypothetical protein
LHIDLESAARLERISSTMADRRFLVRVKQPEFSTQPVKAERADIQGEHLTFINSKGELAAMFLMSVVESWSGSDLG